LNDLINSLQILVNDLIELFPAVIDKERGLCDAEADELREEADLPLLLKVAQEQDLPLAEAIDRLPKRSVGTTLRRVKGSVADGKQTAATYNTTRNENSKISNQVTGSQTVNGGMTFN